MGAEQPSEMARPQHRLLAAALLLVAARYASQLLLAFMAVPAPAPRQLSLRQQRAGSVALQARGGEYEVSDADIQAFYDETISGSGGDPPKGTITAELIVKFFYGDFTPQGFKRYSGLWKGPPPGSIGKKDTKSSNVDEMFEKIN